MGEYQELLQTIALTLGVAWASGINLYAAITALGLAGATGYVDLPQGLEVTQDPLVILAASFMYCVEFMADKIPGVDSVWDAVHTFVRIPAGALLAAAAAGPVDPAIAVATGLLGGALTAATHASKAGTRALINTSPEPLSNWAASVAEDFAVFAGLWAAVQHPVLFLTLLALFVAALIWALPRLWRPICLIARRLANWLGFVDADPASKTRQREIVQPSTRQANPLCLDLQKLRDAGILTEAEYRNARGRLAI